MDDVFYDDELGYYEDDNYPETDGEEYSESELECMLYYHGIYRTFDDLVKMIGVDPDILTDLLEELEPDTPEEEEELIDEALAKTGDEFTPQVIFDEVDGTWRDPEGFEVLLRKQQH